MNNGYTKPINPKTILKNLTILYIEDEDEIRINLEKTLNLLFKSVISVSNAEDALDIFQNEKIDIILSDINLPNKSGIELIKDVRKIDSTIPTILLTAYTDKELLLEAVKLKLINYLTKPIEFDELFKELSNGALEIVNSGKYFLNFTDDIKYDAINHILYQDDIEIDLTNSERKLLELFISNQNKTISIQEIKNYIWEDEEKATDTAFKSLLNKLRKKVGNQTIKNVSGVGYHIVIE